MKYPLAIVDRMLQKLGERLGIGYDIMCTFWKTILRSRLGKKVIKSGMKGIVPAFHGHAHNWKCQVHKSICRIFPAEQSRFGGIPNTRLVWV
jgi:hypothetical protein